MSHNSHNKKDIFITSTIHSDWNIKFNPILCKALEEKGVTCHMAQRDTNQNSTKMDIYNQNIDGIKNSKKILAIGENETINWGVEVGYAFGIKKNIILLTSNEHNIPVMVSGMFNKILRVRDLGVIEKYIDELISAISA